MERLSQVALMMMLQWAVGNRVFQPPVASGPPPTIVQSRSSCGASSLAFSSNVTAGNSILLFHKAESATPPGTGPSDTRGSAFTAGPQSPGAANTIWSYLAPITTSGADTVSIGTLSWPCMVIIELSGHVQVNANAVLFNSGAANPITANVTTTTSTLVLTGVGAYHSTNTVSAYGSNTVVTNANGADAIGALQQAAPTAGTYTGGANIAGPGADSSCMAVLAMAWAP